MPMSNNGRDTVFKNLAALEVAAEAASDGYPFGDPFAPMFASVHPKTGDVVKFSSMEILEIANDVFALETVAVDLLRVIEEHWRKGFLALSVGDRRFTFALDRLRSIIRLKDRLESQTQAG